MDKLIPFEISEFLEDPEAAAEYLKQVTKDGDPDELRRALAHIEAAKAKSTSRHQTD